MNFNETLLAVSQDQATADDQHSEGKLSQSSELRLGLAKMKFEIDYHHLAAEDLVNSRRLFERAFINHLLAHFFHEQHESVQWFLDVDLSLSNCTCCCCC